jgi:hypothetical protein
MHWMQNCILLLYVGTCTRAHRWLLAMGTSLSKNLLSYSVWTIKFLHRLECLIAWIVAHNTLSFMSSSEFSTSNAAVSNWLIIPCGTSNSILYRSLSQIFTSRWLPRFTNNILKKKLLLKILIWPHKLQ